MGLVEQSSLADTLSKLETLDRPVTTNTITTAVKDTFINRTAIADRSYPEVFGTLISYVDGIQAIVEYFKKREPFINKQSIDTSLSLERSSVHTSYDLIHNFEIVFKDQLNVEIDPETTETAISGEAIIYPGFNPNPGDVFYFNMPDDKVGVFVLDQVTPLTIFRGTHFSVNFHMYAYLDDIIDNKLRESVVGELYFDKQSYFSDEVALLTDVSYNQLQQLTASRQALIRLIISKFYDVNYKTIRYDGIYDPFVVEFLLSNISVKDVKLDICALSNTYIDLFNYTIFRAILDHDATILTHTGSTLFYYQQYLWDTNISQVDKFKLILPITNTTLMDAFRLVQAKFNDDDPEYRLVSYYLSNRFYYALKQSFIYGQEISDVSVVLDDMLADETIYDNLTDQAYCVATNSYQDMSYFDTHNASTGSNNDMHLPELEYMILHFIMTHQLDKDYFIDKVLKKFPFSNMTDRDLFFYLPIMIHFIDVIVPRIR